MFDCNQLTGRKRDICRGKDEYGQGIGLENAKRVAYLRKWGLTDDEIKNHLITWPSIPSSGPIGKTRKSQATSGTVKPRQSRVPEGKGGPGSELIRIYKMAGMPACQACYDLADTMDKLGVEGCEEQIDLLVGNILPRAKQWLAENRPWFKRFLHGVGLEDLAIRHKIKQDILMAIEAARVVQETKLGNQEFRTRPAASNQNQTRIPLPVNPIVPCQYRGEVLRTEECSGGRYVSVHYCGVHKECITGGGCELKDTRLPQVCLTCPDVAPLVRTPQVAHIVPAYDPGRDVRPIKGPRHLLYFVAPVSGNGVWKWNVDELLERIHLFDGHRTIAVATPDLADTKSLGRVRHVRRPLDPPEVVQEAFANVRVDQWIVGPNDHVTREAAFWSQLLDSVRELPGVTWFFHTKGVTRDWDQACTWWITASYQTCLDDWATISAQLERYPLTGPFKRYGMFQIAGNHRWHYSGTAFWFRNDDVFSMRPQPRILNTFIGIEAWPGFVARPKDTACCFGDYCDNPYDRGYWERVLIPLWKEWCNHRGINHKKIEDSTR